MSSPEHIHSTLCSAIHELRLVAFTLDGYPRIAEPHDYGVIDGKTKLFCWQVGGQSRSAPPRGWRWAEIVKISDLKMLDQHFAGPRPAPSGKHIGWEQLYASVSQRERLAERNDSGQSDAAPKAASATPASPSGRASTPLAPSPASTPPRRESARRRR